MQNLDRHIHSAQDSINRRIFLKRGATGLGLAALTSLMGGAALADDNGGADKFGGLKALPHFKPKAKRIIYLHQSGAPSQMDLFDYKPRLNEFRAQDLPDSIRMGQRLTGMTSGQKKFPVAPSVFKFKQYGKSGAWLSELLPHTQELADDLCFIKSMHTEAINHDPAITFSRLDRNSPAAPAWARGLRTVWAVRTKTSPRLWS